MATTLYTSLTQQKLAVFDGHLPAMTPLSKAAAKVCDPEYTMGMGAIVEDQVKGLRCPVRGCGLYFHDLGTHIRWEHEDIGGVKGIRDLLSIPESAGLQSYRWREMTSTRAKMLYTRNAYIRERMKEGQRKGAALRREGVGDPDPSKYYGTVGAKNMKDRCIAQLQDKLCSLSKEMGRPATVKAMRKAYGAGVMYHIYKTFGTWENALIECGVR